MSSPSAMKDYYDGAPKPPPEGALDEEMDKFKEAMEEYEKLNGPPPTPAPVSPPTPGVGLPAARLGDLTAHGGIITAPGCPTVLIGKKPAARVTDMHTCPMVDGVKPHVGGPVLPPAAVTTLIGSLPAARVTDMCTCASAPDVIAMGEYSVLIG